MIGDPPLAITIPHELIEAMVELTVGRAIERLRDPEAEGGWPAWMSVETAARYLDVSPERVRKLQARGKLPYYQHAPGCRVFFNRRELDCAMAELRMS
jgi:excisionase family DNA binding protein